MTSSIELGDAVYVQKLSSFINHVGLCVDFINDEPQILDIIPRENARILPLSVFLAGRPISAVRSPSDPVDLVLSRAQQIVDRARNRELRYLPFTFNCQHLVNYCQSGRPFSEQVQAFVSKAAISLLVGVALNAMRSR